jgi:hypothetical protein
MVLKRFGLIRFDSILDRDYKVMVKFLIMEFRHLFVNMMRENGLIRMDFIEEIIS